MDLLYSSTRNSEKKITASQAILKGLADDGGLFVPESIPALDVSIEELSKMPYQQVAYEVMKLFLTDFTEEELKIVSTGHTTASLILLRLHRLSLLTGLTTLSCSMALQ